jgi:hypothetical protein
MIASWAVNGEPVCTDPPITTTTKETKHASPDRPAEAKLDEFAQLWNRPLRRALYDPPPPKPEVKQLPPLQIELAGTIIEPANSMAIIRSQQGRTEYKRVGDTVGPPDGLGKIVEIGANEVVVERGQERITLGVQTKEFR